jgi:SAM-dependent methyltransferase
MSEEHWTSQVFLKNPELFLPLLEERISKAESQVDGIVKIFDKYGVHVNSKVLDLACGIGRHSIELASRDFNILGVDISSDFLSIARKESMKKELSNMCMFIVGDMRKIGFFLEGKPFHSALSLFTSLGYYDEDIDFSILKQLYDLSKENGLLILHMMNKNYGAKLDKDKKIRRINGFIRLQESFFDFNNSRLKARWTFYKEEDNSLKKIGDIGFHNRLYNFKELKVLTASAGWNYLESYSDFSLNEIDKRSKYIVFIAIK